MDLISHALLGRTIGCVDDARWSGPGGRAALVIGALAPDIDIVVAVRGWDRYLHWHEIGTHTIAASPAIAIAVAVVVRIVVKDSRFMRLWWAAWVGVVVGHLGFDLVSGSEIRVFEPWAGRLVGPHWLAMADLSAIAILIGGTIWMRWRRRLAAMSTIAALVVLLAVKAASQQVAASAIERERSGAAGVPEAINGSLFRWMFFERDPRMARASIVNSLSGAVTPAFERPISVEAEAVASVSGLPVVQTFLQLARVPFARVEARDGRRWILWSDLRQCDATKCDLSFGAEVDAEGRPLRQVIRIGPYEQTRPLPDR